MSDVVYPLSVPAELRSFVEGPGLLPGESRREFEDLRRLIVEDIRPNTTIEWLWTLDLAELSWEILRYRCLKQRVFKSHRHNAVEAILQGVDGAGMPGHAQQTLLVQTRRNALQWRQDPIAAAEIESRLAQYGIRCGRYYGRGLRPGSGPARNV